ncbi:MAG: NAD(P)H-dependent oxidoreductase [Chloroflexota bacterium]|nr:NAD(P)H-dependent oxidoreductase [Chloroflexota bacterium]
MTTLTGRRGSTAAAAATTWQIDPSRSELRFLARRMGMTVRGRFPELAGRLDLHLDRLEESAVEAVVKTGSVEPAMGAMQGLLLSDSFLAAEAHPELRFRSTRIEADGDRYTVHGDLAFRGEARQIALEARLTGIDVFGEEQCARIEARGRVDRLIADEELEIELTIVALPAAAGASTRTADERDPTSGQRRSAPDEPPSDPSHPYADDTTIRIVVLVGSLRRGSFNRSLLRAVQEVAPVGVVLEGFSLADVPFYDGDLEAKGDPTPVRALKSAITGADAILLVTPEYNRGLPAVSKNAIDWASRPPFDSPLAGKPVLLMGATTGRSATKYALQQAADSFAYAQAVPFEGRYGLPRAGDRIDDVGRLTDPDTRAELRRVLGAFASSVRKSIATHSKAA